MDESDLDKSELATPFKLHQARRKGRVARGLDLGFLIGLAVFLGYLWVSGEPLIERLAQSARQTLVIAPAIAAEPMTLFAVSAAMFTSAARPIGLMAGFIFLAVLLFELIQTGVVFSTEPLKPDFSRLNPAKGLKKLLSWQMLLNAAKNILKLAVYSVVAFLAIRGAFRDLGPGIIDGASLSMAMARASSRLLLYFLLAAAGFAVLDQFLVRRSFGKQMRMSRREVRRETRDREGEPRMKQRRKRLHAEFVANSKSLRNMRSADVLIVNPVHYAVALRYAPLAMAAPTVVAQGADRFALRLKRLAFVYGVIIVEDARLAQALYRASAMEREVPELFYHEIAKIYLDIRAIQKARGGEQ